MINDTDEIIRNIFEDGKDIVYFDNLEDLYEKAAFYLKRPDIRNEIGRVARKKILKDLLVNLHLLYVKQ